MAAGAAQPVLIDAAIKAGVKRFVPTEFGSNSFHAGAVATFPVLGKKRDVIEGLRGKESASFSWTALATGPFLDL
jgi:hypothetical protein